MAGPRAAAPLADNEAWQWPSRACCRVAPENWAPRVLAPKARLPSLILSLSRPLLTRSPSPARRFFETFSYLPPLSDADLLKQVNYLIKNKVSL